MRSRSQVGSGTESVGKIGAFGAVMVGLSESKTLLDSTRAWYREHVRYTISITSDDLLFSDVAMELYEARERASGKPPHAVRAATWMSGLALRARQSAGIESEDEEWSTSKPMKRKLFVTYDEHSAQTMVIAGVRVKVTYTRPDAPTESIKRSIGPDKISISCATEAHRQRVVEWMNGLVEAANNTKRVPSLHILNSWGGWNRRNDIPLRTFDSIALRGSQANDIKNDLAEFLSSEAEYVKRGMPWHRGYLFEGPPGTGKTSVVKAMAEHFGLDLWYAPLNDLDKDSNLLQLIAEVTPNSLLLLEDIDLVLAATDRSDSRSALKAQITPQGLLNALDGVSTPHGLLTVMTTNHVEKLDPAIRRPGRVDRFEHMGYLTYEQASRLFEIFYGVEPPESLMIGEFDSPAMMTETFKRHIKDPVAGAKAWNLRTLEAEEIRSGV
jgi:hypothetical protein